MIKIGMMKYEFESSMVLPKGEVNTTGERFPCAVCGKSYLRKRHLQRHMRDECIGIPPRFSCELCPSRFRRKYHMVRHLTSKHSIPPAIAQQATGGGTRIPTTTTSSSLGTAAAAAIPNNSHTISNLSILKSNNFESANESDSGTMGGVENLSLRKDLFDNNNGIVKNGGGEIHVSKSSPAHSGGACSSTGTHSPLSTYGLTGAITAISSAFNAVEQRHDAMAIAAAIQLQDERVCLGVNTADGINIKNEPISPNCKITTTTTTTTTTTAEEESAEDVLAKTAANVNDVVSKIEDDWKMKLSLQLISNSLLKERLLNTIPFGSGYNNSN